MSYPRWVGGQVSVGRDGLRLPTDPFVPWLTAMDPGERSQWIDTENVLARAWRVAGEEDHAWADLGTVDRIVTRMGDPGLLVAWWGDDAVPVESAPLARLCAVLVPACRIRGHLMRAALVHAGHLNGLPSTVAGLPQFHVRPWLPLPWVTRFLEGLGLDADEALETHWPSGYEDEVMAAAA